MTSLGMMRGPRRLPELAVTKRCIRTHAGGVISTPRHLLENVRKKITRETRLPNPNLLATSSLLSVAPSPDAPSFSLLLSLLLGLPIALWSYKCLMMVLFQRKIIYMGYIPPGTRQERLSDLPNLSTLQKDYRLEETRIKSSDRTVLSTLVMARKGTERPDCVIFYLQGNAGNPLHRIPVFLSLLSSTTRIGPVILAPAPRSYWSSTNRTPTQKGLLADYSSALRHTVKRWPGIPIVLYGHSLGGAIAVCLLASNDASKRAAPEVHELDEAIRGMILENPFASIPDMVRALYPQTWLPYRYLAPLAWDKWDALSAMRGCSRAFSSSTEQADVHPELGNSQRRGILPRLARNMLVLVSARDEVVPPSMGRAIFGARPSGKESHASEESKVKEEHARLVEIDGALHEDAWQQLQWKREIGRDLEKIVHK